MQSNSSAKIRLILSMTIFGTIGIFRNYIDLPSSFIAMARGIVGMLFLLFVILVIKRNKINFTAIKKNLVPLLLSGVFIGINWILLFEAYRHTTVSTATLCYYMAPVFVILLSPIIFKERFTLKKSLCALAAVVGMFTISGIFGDASSNITGILLGIGAAVFYASVILLNKFIKDIEDEEKTMVQLGAAGISILPYVLLTENLATLSPDTTSLILLLIVSILHTGVAYSLYFGSVGRLKVQTTAIFSYIDPVVALILSGLILKEDFTILHLIGSVLILGSAFISEMPSKKDLKEKQKNY